MKDRLFNLCVNNAPGTILPRTPAMDDGGLIETLGQVDEPLKDILLEVPLSRILSCTLDPVIKADF